MAVFRVAMVGGVPPLLGGGGLERQLDQTARALVARGHDARPVADFRADEAVDIVHSFGCGADVWQQLQHWRRNRVPLVSSPVIVCSPGRAERSLLIGVKLGAVVPNVNSMVRDIVKLSDQAIAITAYERSLIEKLAGAGKPVSIIENGVDRVEPSSTSPIDTSRPYVLMLGTVSPRKGQLAALETLGDKFHFVIVGGHEGSAAEQQRWESIVAAKNATWTGEISDSATVARIVSDAVALLLFSSAEVQSLAVLEALAQGTPVVASDLPSHRELAARWPGWLAPVKNLNEAGTELARLTEARPTGTPPTPSTWADAAAQIEDVYAAVLPSTSS